MACCQFRGAAAQLGSATVKIDVKQGLELENFPSSGGFGHGELQKSSWPAKPAPVPPKHAAWLYNLP